MQKKKIIQPIILCGGQGSRLWPASRVNLPKQFLKLFNGKSLFELTVERLKSLKSSRNPIIVTSEQYKFKVEEILLRKKIDAQIILEPISKNTCPAIFLGAYYANENDILLIMPSDHYIPNIKEFIKMLNFSLSKMDKEKWMIFGIVPNKPSSAYGYIKINKTDVKYKVDDDRIYKVDKFIEKPNIRNAKKLFLSDEYLLNSGIFLVKKETALESISKNAKDIFLLCKVIVEQKSIININQQVSFDLETFEKLPSSSIDYSVLEKETDILCTSFNSEWSDVGSWDSYFDIINEENRKENFIEINGKNNILPSKDRMIVTIGVDDLIIADTKDALLITKKDTSEHLKKVVENFIKENSPYSHDILYDERPWGNYNILFESDVCKVKKLSIFPKKRLSLQYHKRRTEHWFVVAGTATVHVNGKEFELHKGNSINIEKKAKHFIANYTDKELIIIETQIGDYFGEDDIIRLDDPYHRK